MEEKYLERFIAMEQSLKEIDKRLEQAAKESDARFDHLDNRLEKVIADHEDRLRCLEREMPGTASQQSPGNKMKTYTAAGGAGVGIGVILAQAFEVLRPLIERLMHAIK